MKRKFFAFTGITLLLCVFYSCSSKPEQSLLRSYFHALTLDDVTTLSTMALEPVELKVTHWEITNVSEEIIEEAALPGLNKKELDLKKQVEESVGTTLDARDDLDDAKFDLERARTRSARRAAQAKVDELQAKYDEVYARHKELQRQYNEAKTEAAREEEISAFSLGRTDLLNIRELQGEVRKKTVEIHTEGEAGPKNYRLFLRQYSLKDEALNFTYRGRWIILKFEALD